MSQRNTFVTQHIYCEKCFNSLNDTLKKCDIQIQLSDKNLICGHISGEPYLLDFKLREIFIENEFLPCHDIIIGVVGDNGTVYTLKVTKDGDIEQFD